jgi:hypothetical protein
LGKLLFANYAAAGTDDQRLSLGFPPLHQPNLRQLAGGRIVHRTPLLRANASNKMALISCDGNSNRPNRICGFQRFPLQPRSRSAWAVSKRKILASLVHTMNANSVVDAMNNLSPWVAWKTKPLTML